MSDLGIPVFDPSGRMLGNITSAYGEVPQMATDLPAVPSLSGGLQTIQKAAKAAGITGGSIPPTATTGTPGATTGASAANNWFARGVVVVLGLIFIAVGLSQFDRGQAVVRSAIGRI